MSYEMIGKPAEACEFVLMYDNSQNKPECPESLKTCLESWLKLRYRDNTLTMAYKTPMALALGDLPMQFRGPFKDTHDTPQTAGGSTRDNRQSNEIK